MSKYSVLSLSCVVLAYMIPTALFDSARDYIWFALAILALAAINWEYFRLFKRLSKREDE